MSEHYHRAGDRPDGRHATPLVAGRGGAASRAAGVIRDGVERASGYARAWTGAAGETITDMTGRTPEAWARPLRQFVEQSPITALLLATAAGVLVGRTMRQG